MKRLYFCIYIGWPYRAFTCPCREIRMRCSGAPCRQLRITAGAHSCRERGDILRFPDFSQPSPLWRFHITADSEPTRRPACLQPAFIPGSQRGPNSTERRTGWVHQHQSGFGPVEAEQRRSVSQPGRASERRVAQTGSDASISAWLLHGCEDKAQELRRRLGVAFASSWQQQDGRRLALSLGSGSGRSLYRG